MEDRESQTVSNICNKHKTVKGIYCWNCVLEAGKQEELEKVKCVFCKDGACEATVCYSNTQCGARDPLGHPIYKSAEPKPDSSRLLPDEGDIYDANCGQEIACDILPISEADFSTVIEDLLTRFGWRWIHSRPARTDKGWRTALSGDEGFPDYFAVKEGYAIVIEIKSDTGQLSPEQYFWLEALENAGIPSFLLQPKDDFEEIVKCLR